MLTHANISELNVCYDILDSGREFQKKQGFVQWDDEYPTLDLVKEDIEKQIGYVLKIDGKIAAYMAITFDIEPAYNEIEGAWRKNEKYCVVHRMAIHSDFRNQGLTTKIFNLVEELCKQKDVYYIRIDTDFPNKRMQHIFIKNGFKECGVINFKGPKKAYDKILEKKQQ